MLASQAFVVVAAVEEIAVVVAFAEVLELLFDVSAVDVVACRLA